MTDVEVFGDIVCPFTHLGLRNLLNARRERRAQGFVRVRAWPLEWVNGEPLAPSLVAREIAALRAHVAPEAFAGFSPSTFPRTSLPAFGLVAAGYAAGPALGEALAAEVRNALFERGLDIADPSVLGMLGDQYRVVPFDARATEAAVRNDWVQGQTRGVKGSPHFFVGERDWFCPSLRIDKQGEVLSVAFDWSTLDDFLNAAAT